jgi:hypothetical protein
VQTPDRSSASQVSTSGDGLDTGVLETLDQI